MRHIARLLTFSLASGALLLSGCGIGMEAPGGASIAGAAGISGAVHGGQQAVYNANVRLFSAGAGGYGIGSTLLATSLPTNTSGQFSFTKLPANGTSTGTTPVWACPTTGNPIIYITAIGGNTNGTGTGGTNNAASAMMAVLGPCSGITNNTFVTLNEITTVASVFSMAQYINPGTTAGTVTMGTSATAQGNTGIVNAASSIANLVNIGSGNIIPPPVYTAGGTNGTGTVAVTATAESAKIVAIADILAACVNSTTAASNNCADLFANALPPLSAAYTSQPGVTFTAPVDTIQAAYYMAVNPAALGPFTACNQAGVTTTMGCLYGLIGGTGAAFQGYVSAQPSDWTIGVTYTATGACTGAGTVTAPTGGAFFFGPTKAAVDASGNLWFINGGASVTASNIYANLSELSPIGVPLACLGTSSNGRGLTIDPTGNVWASFNSTTPVSALLELPVGGSSLLTYPTTIGATANTPYTATSDGTGNIFFTNITGGLLLEFPVGSTTSTVPTLVTSSATLSGGTSTLTTNYSAADPSGHIFVGDSTNSNLYEVFPATGNFGSTALKTTSYGLAVDSGGFVYNGTTCCGTGTTNYKELEKTFPGSTGVGTVTASAQYLGGINGVRSVQLDGAANAWVGNEFSSTGPNTVASQYPLTEIAVPTVAGSTAGNFVANTTFVSLSPTGANLAPTACTTSLGCPTGGGFIKNDFIEIRDIGIDPSGNVWALNTGTEVSGNTYSGLSITEVIGAAVPTVTPLSAAIAAGKLAQKP